MRLAKRSLLIAFLLATFPVLTSPALAQFEEPDTISRLGFGPFVEIFFRGQRATFVSATGNDTELSLSGGPAFGVRLEYRLTGTLGLGVTASYSNPDEELEARAVREIGAGLTQFQFTGEAHLRVKPEIPGYFILGGGVRTGDPDDGAVHSESYSEPLGILGAGLRLVSRRHWLARLEFRFNFVAPAEQPGLEMKNLATDFSIGLGMILRP